MSDRIERIILRNLFFNEDFTRKVLPFIKEEFFTSKNESILFGEVSNFIHKYKNLPTKETINVELTKRKDLREDELTEIKTIVNKLDKQEVEDKQKLSVIFDYNILKNPKDVDIDEQEFIDHIGDILIDLVEEQLATGKLDLKFEDTNEW